MTRTRTPTPVHPRPAPESATAVTPDDTGSRLSVPPPLPATPPVIESAVPTERTVAIQHLAASAEKSAAASESVAHSAAAVAAQVPLVVQVLDKVFDGVAIVTLYMLARGHMLGGEIAAGMIVFVATGNNGIRALSQRAGGPAVGVAGMALLALLSVVGYAPAVAAAPVAVAVLHRASGGHATRRQMAALLAVSLLGALAVPAVLWLAGGVR